MIYLIYLVPFIFSSFVGIIEKKKNKLLIVVLSIFLILFASLRNHVGTDWPAYYRFYQYGVNNVEIGYSTINNFFGDLGLPYFVFLIAINVLSIGLLTKGLVQFSAIPALSLLIYYSDLYLYFNFSGMRQSIALGFTTFALLYSFGSKRNIYIFFGLILCAMSFHISSIIFSLAFFIPQRKFTKKEMIILLIGFSFFSSFVFFASSFLTGIFAKKAEFYLELQESSNTAMNFIIGLLRRSITILLVLMFGRKVIFSHNLSAYIFNLYLIGYGIFATTYLISPDIGVRMSVYFTTLEMILLANLIYLVKRTDIKFIIFLIVLITCIYKVSNYLSIEAYEYQSIL